MDTSPGPLLVVLCGLPGTGKSTLARRLAPALDAALLDKDRVREALFGASGVEHSREQDDFCCRVLYDTADWLLTTGRRRAVVLDGRTYARQGQLQPVLDLARRTGAVALLVQCTCAPEVARARLAADLGDGLHPAADRTPALHEELRRQACPLPDERLVLATDEATPSALLERCLQWIAARAHPR